jgi:hypothetical protein
MSIPTSLACCFNLRLLGQKKRKKEKKKKRKKRKKKKKRIRQQHVAMHEAPLASRRCTRPFWCGALYLLLVDASQGNLGYDKGQSYTYMP